MGVCLFTRVNMWGEANLWQELSDYIEISRWKAHLSLCLSLAIFFLGLYSSSAMMRQCWGSAKSFASCTSARVETARWKPWQFPKCFSDFPIVTLCQTASHTPKISGIKRAHKTQELERKSLRQSSLHYTPAMKSQHSLFFLTDLSPLSCGQVSPTSYLIMSRSAFLHTFTCSPYQKFHKRSVTSLKTLQVNI